MSTKKSAPAEFAQADATTDTAPQPDAKPAKKAVVIVHTDNSKNGHLAARRLARAKAQQEQK